MFRSMGLLVVATLVCALGCATTAPDRRSPPVLAVDSAAVQSCAVAADCAVDACHIATCVAGACRLDARVCNAPPADADPLAPCRAGAATFSVKLGGTCGGTTCDPASGCDYRAVDVACPPADALTSPAAPHRLPQTQPYAVALRNYLATLTEEDFRITLPDRDPVKAGVQPWWFDAAYYTGDKAKERLFEYFVMADGHARDVPTTAGLRLTPDGFTLAQIENTALAGIRLTVGRGGMFEPADTAWWSRWSNPGNPYGQGQNARAARLRAFVGAAVDLMMRDRSPGTAMYHLAIPMSYYGFAYEVAKGELDACTQAAFEFGLRRMLTRTEGRAYTTVNGNNDMGTPLFAGLVHGGRATADPEFKARAIALAKKVLYSVVRSPAGYFEHCGAGDPGRSYDPSYEGITLRYLSWAAAASGDDPDWLFLRNIVKQHAKLKVFMTLPDPDGQHLGPSHFANATSAPAALDQWLGKGREYGLAQLGGDAATLAFTQRKRGGDFNYFEGFPAESRMRTLLATTNVRMNTVYPESGYYPKFTLAKAWPATKWSAIFWTEGLSGAHFYRDGFYADLEALAQAGSPLTKAPFQRDGDVFEAFTDEFVFAKLGDDFGAIVHTGPVAKEWGGANPDVYTPGFGGGAISAFWTKDAGSVLLGFARGIQAPSAEAWARSQEWMTHTITGKTATGTFSAARILNPTRTTTIDHAARSADIVVSGKIQRTSSSFAAQTGALVSPIDYKRTFEIRGNGAQRGIFVTTQLTGDGKNTVTSLAETLPLFLRESRRQNATTVASRVLFILEDGSTRVINPEDVTTDHATSNVVAVKLGRFSGSVWIVFEDPQTLRFAPALTGTDYQWFPRGRPLRVDLRRDGPTPLTQERLRYRVGPAACAATPDCPIGTCIEGVCIPPGPPPPPPPPASWPPPSP